MDSLERTMGDISYLWTSQELQSFYISQVFFLSRGKEGDKAYCIVVSSQPGYKWLQISCVGDSGGAANICLRLICYCQSFHHPATPPSPSFDVVSTDLKTCCWGSSSLLCSFGRFIAVERKMKWMFVLPFVSDVHTFQRNAAIANQHGCGTRKLNSAT